jgi:folate-binding protein YgfZ
VPEPYAVWLDRDVVAVSGPESGTFLQGQLSQDVLVMVADDSAWSWVLAPTGKVDALVRVIRRADDEWLLDTDGGWGEALLTRLNRFKLRTKVEFELRPWKVLGVRGGGIGAGQVVVPAWPETSGVDVFDVEPVVADGMAAISAQEYEAERIAAGFPKMGAELTEKTIPAETGLNDRTVSFTKGCYTGQELVARIDSRGGNVPRHLRGLGLTEPLEAGAELIDSEGKTAGTVTSVAFSPERGWVALGYVRRGVEVGAALRAGPEGPEVEVRELPL